MNQPIEENLLSLAHRLAFNMVSCSFPTSQGKSTFNEIFDEKMTYRNRSRNILIIGAGATHNLCPDIPLAKDFNKILRKKFDTFYGKDFYERIVEKELGRLTNLYKLNEEEFETQLAAYSRFDKDLVLDVLADTYNLRYPVSLFYEIVAHMFKHRFIDVIINFNFDEMLDNAIEEEMSPREYQFIYSDGHCPEKGEEANIFIKSGRLRQPVYIKPHGTISHASTLRFRRHDYYNLPSRIKNTLQFLFEGNTDESSRHLPINLMVAGFGLNSFELNQIITGSLKNKQGHNLFYFDHFKPEQLQDFEAKRRPADLTVFSNSNSCLFPLDVANNRSPYSLNNYFYRLWQNIETLFNKGYMPKDISRHVVIAELFNPLSQSLLVTTNGEPRQKEAIRKYLDQRLVVELGLEILNANDGILNITHIIEGRIGKYYNLLRASNKHCKSIYAYISDLGLEQYKPGINDTWTFVPTETFKDELHEKIFDYLDNTVRTNTNRANASDMLITAVRKIKKKGGKFLNILPSFFNNKISIFESITEDSLINTDIKWIYKFRRYFYNSDDLKEWDLALSISENGSVFGEPQMIEALKTKKLVLVCAYNSNEGRENKYDKLINGKLREIKESFLYEENGSAILKLLPTRNHNQHIILLCKVSPHKITPIYGIYYQRRLMSRKVSPLVIDKGQQKDLATLLSIFKTYYERSVKEEQLRFLEKNAERLKKMKKDGVAIDFENPVIKDLLETNLGQVNVEQHLLDRYFHR